MMGKNLGDVLSGARFSVSYLLYAGEEEARLRAKDICYEQTVEFPEDITPAGPIADQIVGRIEELSPVDGPSGVRVFRALISYAVESTAGNLVQLLNVVFGNISMKPGIKVERLFLPARITSAFRGPRFGRDGLRALLGIPSRPLVCTALKPMGLSAEELAQQAYRFALGGIDIIKDDHGLNDQVFCPFEERVARCAEAVARAGSRTGRKILYMPNVTAPADRLLPAAHRARELGAGAFMVCPGLAGLDAVRVLAEEDSIGLPVMAHPAFLGSFVTSAENGFSHGALFGQLMRLSGADMTVFPNWGGRFSFTREECRQIADACAEQMGGMRTIFPAPGGGMTTDRARDMREVYGREFVLLMGGGLHRHSPDLTRNAEYFVEMVSSL
jgi:S-methyl-5-thioribulose 1-phosphate isomerase